jgi:hypothetical protein
MGTPFHIGSRYNVGGKEKIVFAKLLVLMAACLVERWGCFDFDGRPKSIAPDHHSEKSCNSFRVIRLTLRASQGFRTLFPRNPPLGQSLHTPNVRLSSRFKTLSSVHDFQYLYGNQIEKNQSSECTTCARENFHRAILSQLRGPVASNKLSNVLHQSLWIVERGKVTAHRTFFAYTHNKKRV